MRGFVNENIQEKPAARVNFPLERDNAPSLKGTDSRNPLLRGIGGPEPSDFVQGTLRQAAGWHPLWSAGPAGKILRGLRSLKTES